MMMNNKQRDLKRPLSRPALTIMSINIEGILSNKEEILSELCKTHFCDVICLHGDIIFKKPSRKL